MKKEFLGQTTIEIALAIIMGVLLVTGVMVIRYRFLHAFTRFESASRIRARSSQAHLTGGYRRKCCLGGLICKHRSNARQAAALSAFSQWRSPFMYSVDIFQAGVSPICSLKSFSGSLPLRNFACNQKNLNSSNTFQYSE